MAARRAAEAPARGELVPPLSAIPQRSAAVLLFDHLAVHGKRVDDASASLPARALIPPKVSDATSGVGRIGLAEAGRDRGLGLRGGRDKS